MTAPITIADLARARQPAAFFADGAAAVARKLLGCALVHGERAGIIVETEAYLGPEDLASHARFGPTARTSVMFGPGGVSYVYLCYGIHHLFNIVTGAVGDGQAVLIRAIAPYVGLPGDPAIGRGPGKVTTALGLDRRHDRRDLATGDLFVAAALTPSRIARGPRIGVAYAGAWADRPLRFWWRDHASVSRTPRRG
jgi:DNA-3-methyladenine glycosylase